jgi:hypothetical protein
VCYTTFNAFLMMTGCFPPCRIGHAAEEYVSRARKLTEMCAKNSSVHGSADVAAIDARDGGKVRRGVHRLM